MEWLAVFSATTMLYDLQGSDQEKAWYLSLFWCEFENGCSVIDSIYVLLSM